MDSINWDSLTEDNCTVSLLLTMQCNFKCGHCMYNCGPNRDAEYMSDNTLSSVSVLIDRLNESEVYPSLNLVGGEPTLNLDRLGQIVCTASYMEADLQMTTNGWWLQDAEKTRDFFRAIQPVIPQDGYGDEFSLRISSDEFHDRFRPGWMQSDRLKYILTDIWESGDTLYTPIYYCEDCGVIEPDEHCTCPECGSDCDIDNYEDALGFAVPQPEDDNPWIYIERNDGLRTVIPTGRGKRAGGMNEYTCTGKYPPTNLSFTPDGTLCDICCKGSWCEFGTVEDDPLVLLAIAWQFQKEMHPSCSECRSLAEDWKRDRLEEVRRAVMAQREIQDDG